MNARELREELANAVTHGVGVVLSLAAGVILLLLASRSPSFWELAGVTVFVATLLLLYAASTLYHGARTPRVKRRLQVLDHCAIYLLIAGTFTPFALGPLRGPGGVVLLTALWLLAWAGVVFKLFCTGRFHRLSTAIYLVMGWIGGLAALRMGQELTGATIVWLLAGGVVYTAGTAFYHAERLPYAHSIWHLFVIAGSACHVTAIALQL
jgi:hemolysin III